MISAGDKFSARDLRQSVDEVCASDVLSHVKPEKLGALTVVGDLMLDMLSVKPEIYAQYRIQQFDDIKSSAVNLDKQLRKAGFKTTYSFSHQYFTPGLKSEQIIKDAYCLEYFQNLFMIVSPMPGHKKQLNQIFEDAFRISYYYAQYLWVCNREACGPIAQGLVYPGFENWGQIIGAILGVGFHFHPNDVYEFSINHIHPDITKDAYDARYAAQLNFKDLLMTKYGIDTGCLVLSAQSQEKLSRILTKSDTPYWVQVLQKLCHIKAR